MGKKIEEAMVVSLVQMMKLNDEVSDLYQKLNDLADLIRDSADGTECAEEVSND
jgi:hypothetical protein